MSVKKPPSGFLRDAYATHKHDKNKVSDTTTESEKENTTKSPEKNETENDRLLSSTIDSHSVQLTSHRLKNRDTLKRSRSSHGNLEKIPKTNGNLKRENHRLEEYAKSHLTKEHSSKEHPAEKHLIKEHSIKEHPVKEHLQSEHSAKKHSIKEYPAKDHPTKEQSAREHHAK